MDSYDTGYNIKYASEFVVFIKSDRAAMKNKILTETKAEDQQRELDKIFEQGDAVLSLAEHRYLGEVSFRFWSGSDNVWHKITFTRARN